MPYEIIFLVVLVNRFGLKNAMLQNELHNAVYKVCFL